MVDEYDQQVSTHMDGEQLHSHIPACQLGTPRELKITLNGHLCSSVAALCMGIAAPKRLDQPQEGAGANPPPFPRVGPSRPPKMHGKAECCRSLKVLLCVLVSLTSFAPMLLHSPVHTVGITLTVPLAQLMYLSLALVPTTKP